MDPKVLIDGLILYLGLVVLLTLHEFGHAWTAWKCGDDTARLEGRVSLNPIVHMDLIGTVILPLLLILVPAAGGLLIGWAKPVPVNPANLRNRHMDDILVTLAGPGMNLLLAFVILGLARGGMLLESESIREVCVEVARLSLLLCFFNLLPIPPLDGSQVVRVVLGMSWETYHQISRYGFLILILVLQIRQVQIVLAVLTNRSLTAIAGWLGVQLL
jgi:Zn-dependent protease